MTREEALRLLYQFAGTVKEPIRAGGIERLLEKVAASEDPDALRAYPR